ncbi:OprD family outer membrane porin [Pseudomonas sp. D2-3]
MPQQGDGGKHWERVIELRYRVPGGAAKGLSVALAHAAHRANAAQAGVDIDRLYLVVEYPIGGAF